MIMNKYQLLKPIRVTVISIFVNSVVIIDIMTNNMNKNHVVYFNVFKSRFNVLKTFDGEYRQIFRTKFSLRKIFLKEYESRYRYTINCSKMCLYKYIF